MENKKVKIEYSSKAERIKKIVAKTYMYLILFLMYLPILVLIIYSFTDSDQLGIWNGFSFNLYIALFKNKRT